MLASNGLKTGVPCALASLSVQGSILFTEEDKNENFVLYYDGPCLPKVINQPSL